jgi:hypothetical protein
MHLRSYFWPKDVFNPKNTADQHSIERKDSIPPGHVDWFKNPIPTLDSF